MIFDFLIFSFHVDRYQHKQLEHPELIKKRVGSPSTSPLKSPPETKKTQTRDAKANHNNNSSGGGGGGTKNSTSNTSTSSHGKKKESGTKNSNQNHKKNRPLELDVFSFDLGNTVSSGRGGDGAIATNHKKSSRKIEQPITNNHHKKSTKSKNNNKPTVVEVDDDGEPTPRTLRALGLGIRRR